MGNEDTKLTKAFEDMGFRTLIVTFLEDGPASGTLPTQTNAKNWKKNKKILNDVMWDRDGKWINRPFYEKWPGDANGQARGFPVWFIVDTNDMLVWDSLTGYDANVLTTNISQIQDLVDFLRTSSGWQPDADAGLDGGI
jgi:hypothetical protein